jgi:hypothetical protein
MKDSRTMLQPIKRTALLAVVAAAWSCEALPETSEAELEELTQACAEGTELATVGVGDDAVKACLPLADVRIVACPAGATLAGDAPPRAARQRCEREKNVRHGASREWHANGRDRTYTEWWGGAKHGNFKLWYDNGQVRAEGAHVHGQPAGEWVYYAEDGSVLQRRVFDAKPPAASWLADAIAGRPPVKSE